MAYRVQLKEQLDLNSGTRSLILTVLASIYVPLAFVSSYFGMNAKEFTNGGLVSTTTFWEVSIPVMVASIIVPIVFQGYSFGWLLKLFAQDTSYGSSMRVVLNPAFYWL